MGLRQAIRNNPAVGAAVAVAVLGVAGFILMRKPAPPAAGDAYYMDLKTGDLFVHTQRAAPPIDAPSGSGLGVRAHVFGCGDCGEANQRVAYIEKFSDEAIAAMGATPADEQEDYRLQQTIINGRLVAFPPRDGAEPQWISGETEHGLAVLAAASKVCNGSAGQRCSP